MDYQYIKIKVWVLTIRNKSNQLKIEDVAIVSWFVKHSVFFTHPVVTLLFWFVYDHVIKIRVP